MSRPQRAATVQSAASKFAELRALKASGKRRIDTYEDTQEDDIYEEVDEAGYRQVVRDRLERDDFVVDDNGLGYADNGAEEWERNQDDYASESEIDTQKRSVNGKVDKKANDKPSGESISKYLNRKTIAVPIVKTVDKEQDREFLADILGDLDQQAPILGTNKKRIREESKSTRSRKRLSSPPLQASTERGKTINREAEASVPYSTQETQYGVDTTMDDIEWTNGAVLPDQPASLDRDSVRETKEEHGDETFRVSSVASYSGKVERPPNQQGFKMRTIPDTQGVAATSPAPLLSSDTIDADSWISVNKSLNILTTPSRIGAISKVDGKDTAEQSGKVLFYWTDYVELNGVLGLFGKVKNQITGQFISAFCRVEGIMRNLFFLPRDFRRSQPDEAIGMAAVHHEVSDLFTRGKITEFKAKSSNRKYAFELPDIPTQSDYLKVLYSYKLPMLPTEVQGDTFSHVFGTNTSIFEQFVLYRKIMGPCWLELTNVDFKAAQNSTWCRTEFGVSDAEHVVVIPDHTALSLPETPPLTLMSLAFRTIVNQKENRQEVVVASARIYENVNLEESIPADKLPCQTFTVIRPLRTVFPNGFEAEARKHSIVPERNETALWNAFMAKWQNVDPDVLIGHNWENVDFGLLLARLKDRKTQNWHRVGRLKRTDWPKIYGRAGFFAEKQLAVGRLMCDLSNDLGKSLIKAQSWSLTELCKLELGIVRPDVDSEKALQSWTDTSRGLVDFAMQCSMDTYYIAAIAIKVQILPLAKQLTNLAGNSWARTLSGTRAERNEYILLHEFYRNKYICPDKIWSKSKASTANADEDDAEESPTGKKKDKFKGGLVFEPEKGLYDKFILVMDFNSLYPSIIQEYNICFTTVDRSITAETTSEEESIPDPPDRDIPQGVLPRLIATLVNRRRQVKSLMKDKDATDAQKAVWDIRQQALKLTANSMYGCLGYTKSRFYARPLAILTTYKGREVLTNTKELAESQQLQVIYGDTDSVMINTNVDNYLEATKIGNEFKKNVNAKYRLLEIDIDNVFQRMLLHAKKKYAALVLFELNGVLEVKTEVKGLDMRRREYCALSKEASQYCLDQILSGQHTEIVVEKIHEYLRNFAAQMRAGAFPVPRFIIFNKLGKNPEDYPNGKTMPHVQVALKRKAKGDMVKINDVMQYIITAEENDARHVADRAYPAQDVTKADSELKVDYNYYLANQILPPLERLCAPIDGTDRTRIAECLGLDPNKYRVNELTEESTKKITMYEATLSDEERYRDSKPPQFYCRACKSSSEWRGLVISSQNTAADGLKCSCGQLYSTISLNAQISAQIGGFIDRYYQGWVICDDSQCGARTQSVGVYGKRCISGVCRGEMRYEWNDKTYYNQLLYFDYLFDVDKAKEAASGTDRETILAVAEYNRPRFETTRGIIQSYLKKCGRRYVDLTSIFSFMAVTA